MAVICLGMGLVTLWASLSVGSRSVRYTFLVVVTILAAAFAHQAMELSGLSRPGIAGPVGVAALVAYVVTTSIILHGLRYLGYRIARFNVRSGRMVFMSRI